MVNVSAIEFHSLMENNDELIAKQRNDVTMHELYNYLNKENDTMIANVHKSFRKSIHKISINPEGIIVYIHHGEEKVVAPSCIRKDVLDMCHSSYLSGHQGIYKTHQRVLSRFWWPELFNDIVEMIKKCDLCQRTKSENRKRGEMCLRVWPTKPLDLVSIDFLVDLPRTARGNTHILVINDHFSRFIRLYAIKNRLAETAAKSVADYFLDFGIPNKLLSDKDPSFEAKLFQELMRILKIKKIRTSGYRPQTNGLTEQSNSIIKKYLTIYLDECSEKDNWDLLLKQLAYAYNSSIHSSTKHSPAQLMFGREFKIPIDMLYGNCNKRGTQSIVEFRKNLKSMYDCAQRVMGERQLKIKEHYDRKRINDPLLVGDMVYVLNPRNKNVKLKANYEGPFTITDKSENVYAIQIVRRNKVTVEWLPRDRLRRCHHHVILNDEVIASESSNDNDDDQLYSDSSSSSDDEDYTEGVPQGYNFRQRPRPAIQRLQVSFLKLL